MFSMRLKPNSSVVDLVRIFKIFLTITSIQQRTLSLVKEPSGRRKLGWRMSKRSITTSSHGFSVVEILTVVAILAILVAIVAPSIEKTMAGARSAQCLSNLRAYGVAIVTFAADNNNKLPPFYPSQSPAWYQSLNQQMGTGGINSWMPEKLQCPEIRNLLKKRGYTILANTYWMCFGNTVDRLNNPRRLGWMKLRGPSECVMLADVNPSNSIAMTPNSAYFGSYGGFNKTDVAEVHGKGANFLFFDGHAKTIPVAEVQKRDTWFKMMNTDYNNPWGAWYEP